MIAFVIRSLFRGALLTGEENPDEIIEEGLNSAIKQMQEMVVNPGQQTVLDDTIIPAFEARKSSIYPPDLWNDVSCAPYCSFMSQTVETGNQIMRLAYTTARTVYIKNFFI